MKCRQLEISLASMEYRKQLKKRGPRRIVIATGLGRTFASVKVENYKHSSKSLHSNLQEAIFYIFPSPKSCIASRFPLAMLVQTILRNRIVNAMITPPMIFVLGPQTREPRSQFMPPSPNAVACQKERSRSRKADEDAKPEFSLFGPRCSIHRGQKNALIILNYNCIAKLGVE